MTEQTTKTFDLVGNIMAYESGETDTKQTLELFAHLIKTGMAWQLQGSIYGRPAASLIERGIISPAGVIDWEQVEALTE